jgi:integrase
MPRKSSKGPRLWLQPERPRANGSVEASVWCILDDGGFKRSTGCGPEDRGSAEERLAEYLAEKRIRNRPRERGASEVDVADVLAIYAADVAPKHSRPRETAGRISRLLDWWGDKRLSDVTGATCRAYADYRACTGARRELEDLRAAIVYHRKEGLCREVVEVVLPPKSESRERWITRSEAARLVWTAWRHREVQKGVETDRRPWRHVARFILVALKTGTRVGAICSASFEPFQGRGWVDLERGVFYRRPHGEAETKKRKPPVRIPPGLLSHMKRWRDRNRQTYVVEWRRRPVKDVDKAFRKAAAAAGLPDVTPHVLRHSAATWLMQSGVDKWEAAGFLGMTEETLDRVYAHHHPDHQSGATAAIEHGHRRPRKDAEKIPPEPREQRRTNVVDLARKSIR